MFLWSRESGFQAIPNPIAATAAAEGINDLGHVVGRTYSGPAREQRTFAWSPSLGFTYLDSAGIPDGAGLPINAAGNITGSIGGLSSYARAFVWTPAGEVTRIPAFLSDSSASYTGFAINSSGAIAGNVIAGAEWLAFRWSPKDGGKLLPGIGNAPHTYAVAINDAGQVLGYDGVWEQWDPVLSMANPILWDANGNPAELVPDCRRSCTIDLAALNNRGEVAGTLYGRAFRWIYGKGIAFIPGSGSTWARGMNDSGAMIVAIGGAGWRGKLWTSEGQVIDLGVPSWATQVLPRAINNKGIVVGNFW